MVEAISSVEGVLEDFPTPILPKIGVEPTREGPIDLHRLVSGNTAYVASNFRGGRHEDLMLMMTSEEYKTQTIFLFVPMHNPGDYPQSIGNVQEQALGTEKFRQNQALLRKYTAVDGAFKK